ncbi:MAG: LL-diaminopimelate aminotransferase [Bacteroidales bacterium]
MVKINEFYKGLNESYLFSDIAAKVANYKSMYPEAEVISLGVGDVTQPLSKAVIEGMHAAVDEMSVAQTFRGYAPEWGYDFLKEAINKNDYISRGLDFSDTEIVVTDGISSAIGHIGQIFSVDNIVAISDPVYPVYIDTNVMEGRAGKFINESKWNRIVYMECNRENGFSPAIPDCKVDVIYLCSPNNPTGSVINRAQLTEWVKYAKSVGALILFDGAYQGFITDEDVPHSIYEIEGAKEVAIEFRSFSKTAGFTGVRCGYTIVPKELMGYDKDGNPMSINSLWRRLISTTSNGVSYVVQRAAMAVYTEEGQKQIKDNIAYYMKNAKTIMEALRYAGFRVYGGVNAPYIWLEVPKGMTSWNFFDKLLRECQIIGTPGVGFGPAGEGYFRLTSFASAENVEKAMERIKAWKI